AYVGEEPAALSRKEYELLFQLAAADGRVLEREDVYQRVWGYTMVRGDRSVDVFVRKLRQKLERVSPGWRYMHTHFGVGYRFAAERQSDAEAPEPVRATEPVRAAEPTGPSEPMRPPEPAPAPVRAAEVRPAAPQDRPPNSAAYDYLTEAALSHKR